MSGTNLKILGILFIAAGLMIILRGFGLIPEFILMNLDVINLSAGLLIVFFTMGRNSRLALFVGSALFIFGVQMYAANNFEILSTQYLTVPVVMFSAGAGFLALYFDNTRAKVFLSTSMILFLFGYLSVLFYKEIAQLKLLNKFAAETVELWPLFFVLIGLSVLIEKRK